LRLGGVPPETVRPDPWTAILLLFHDHEWERAARLGARYPGFLHRRARGLRARQARLEDLARDGLGPDRLARITSPVGLIPRTREPGVLALSALAEIMGAYEALHPLA
jgi:xanthine dehydrogenase accessory factor